MKKILFLLCFIALFGCSKNETIPAPPPSDIETSHLTTDDMVLIDDIIHLKISKEEAIKRGVPASEYELLEETLTIHNNKTAEILDRIGRKNVQTKSSNSITLAWGTLQYPNAFYGNVASPFPVSITGEGDGGITLNYTFGTNYDNSGYHTLYYNIGGMGQILEWGYAQGEIPFPGFTFGLVSFEYYYEGLGNYGICFYQIYDNTV